MFKNEEEQITYIKENYSEVTDQRIDNDHWDIYCPKCKMVRGFQVVIRGFTARQSEKYSTYSIDYGAPQSIYFHCPVCDSYKMWIIFVLNEKTDDQIPVNRYYKVTSLPGEGLEEIEELPAEPQALRVAYRQAIRAMDANAHIAAAAMFRRALQIITREILGAKPDSIAAELNSLIGTKYNGVIITSDFTDNGYIIKESGNQAAHPDKDPDLLDFIQQDASDLQRIFMELVGEIFVVPKVAKKAKEEFLQRRKINL